MKFKHLILLVLYAPLMVLAQARQTKVNERLRQELKEIYQFDQGVRSRFDSINHVYNDRLPAHLADSLFKDWETTDSICLERVEAIISQYGYPGKDLVGDQSETVFLVIQHADLPLQEKYFPLLKNAMENGDIRPSRFALLIDRLKVRKGQKQIYGTQLKKTGANWSFFPIEDEENVNKRREQMGLGPIQEYALKFGINYPDSN